MAQGDGGRSRRRSIRSISAADSRSITGSRCPRSRISVAPINAALDALPHEVRVIAEPGRYIVAPAGIGVATVMGRAQRQGNWWYYLDDGVYGSSAASSTNMRRYPVESLRGGPTEPAVLAGPTCDSIDVIDDQLELPRAARRGSRRGA